MFHWIILNLVRAAFFSNANQECWKSPWDLWNFWYTCHSIGDMIRSIRYMQIECCICWSTRYRRFCQGFTDIEIGIWTVDENCWVSQFWFSAIENQIMIGRVRIENWTQWFINNSILPTESKIWFCISSSNWWLPFCSLISFWLSKKVFLRICNTGSWRSKVKAISTLMNLEVMVVNISGSWTREQTLNLILDPPQGNPLMGSNG